MARTRRRTRIFSSDGRFVSFSSQATNLVAGDNNGVRDIFRNDRLNGTTERVSLGLLGGETNADSYFSFISDDGRFIAYNSVADNVVANDADDQLDAFLYDASDGSTTLLAGGNKDIYVGSMTGDAQYVVYSTLSNDQVAGDTNDLLDVFLLKRTT